MKHISNVEDKVHSFNGANDAIGTLILKFDTAEQLDYRMNRIGEWVKMIVNNYSRRKRWIF